MKEKITHDLLRLESESFVRRLIKVPLIYPLMLLTLLPSILYNGLCVCHSGWTAGGGNK